MEPKCSMRTTRLAFAALTMLATAFGPAARAQACDPNGPDCVVFTSLVDRLPGVRNPPEVQPTTRLRGINRWSADRPAAVDDRGPTHTQSPSSYPAHYLGTGKGYACAATAVGARVLLTSAHCIEPKRTYAVTVENQRAPLRCVPHPDYQPPAVPKDACAGQPPSCHADVALCWVDDTRLELREPVPLAAESTSRPQPPLLGVMTAGFCGTAVLSRIVLAEFVRTDDVAGSAHGFFTATSNWQTMCEGDSGAGLYRGGVLVGVVSRADQAAGRQTFNSSLGDPRIRRFLVGFQAEVAGIKPVTPIAGMPPP